jgi:hypothetical protein
MNDIAKAKSSMTNAGFISSVLLGLIFFNCFILKIKWGQIDHATWRKVAHFLILANITVNIHMKNERNKENG